MPKKNNNGFEYNLPLSDMTYFTNKSYFQIPKNLSIPKQAANLLLHFRIYP
jgi:hypothetical protein